MCSTLQSPRAANAFSSACAARTCPAPDDADSSSTRGLFFMRGKSLRRSFSLGSLALARRQFFQDFAPHLLQFTEARQIFLKIMIQQLRFLRAKFISQNHVAELYGMWQQRVLLQLIKSRFGVVVIHEFPRAESIPQVHCTRTRVPCGNRRKGKMTNFRRTDQAAFADTGMNS